MLKLRVFGSEGCPACQALMSDLKEASIEYDFIDAIADETQELCDLHEVDDLPHLQYILDDDKVVFNYRGRLTSYVLQSIAETLRKEYCN